MGERERENAGEDSIKVVCRFRPLNDSEEKAGSQFIVKFPKGTEENCLSIGVRIFFFIRISVGFCISHIFPYCSGTPLGHVILYSVSS